MNEFKWIERAPDCRSCAHELDNSCERTLERVINIRKKHSKCKQCERLRDIENELKDGV